MRWPEEKYIRWGGIPILGFIMSFIVKDHRHEGSSIMYNGLMSIIFTAVLWNGCVIIIMALRRALPEMKSTSKRLFITSISLAVFLVIGANSIRLLLGIVSFKELFVVETLFQHTPINMVAAFMVASIYEGTYFFGKWKESIKLNEELKNQQIRTQFEVLQNQMSPHFLFNSLNTLTTLIAEDPKIAIDFTQTLSEVYRYILQNKEKELVTLKSELEFSKSYIFLLQMRYPENLEIKFSIDPDYERQYIAPLTLQMLLENAIKHNEISKTRPLKIEIYIDNGESIVVKNKLQIKKTLEKSTKTGLSNIRKRYEYLGNREIDIITSQSNFMVAVPLINLIQESDFVKEEVL